MATNNFRTQDNFPLFATTIFDGYYYEDEETGEGKYFDGDTWLYEYAEKKIEEFNNSLQYYRISLESGYYSGVQIILEEKQGVYVYIPHSGDFTPKEWKELRAEEKKNYGRYHDFDLPYAERVKAERKEIAKIERYCRTVLQEEYSFDEYVCTARFDNGEAFYGLASNESNKIKSKIA